MKIISERNNINELDQSIFQSCLKGRWYHAQRAYVCVSRSNGQTKYTAISLNFFERMALIIYQLFRRNYFSQNFEGHVKVLDSNLLTTEISKASTIGQEIIGPKFSSNEEWDELIPKNSFASPQELALGINQSLIDHFTSTTTSQLSVKIEDKCIFLIVKNHKMALKDYITAINWSSLAIPQFDKAQTERYFKQTLLLKRLLERTSKHLQKTISECALLAYIEYELFYAINHLMREGLATNYDLFNHCTSLDSNLAHPKTYESYNICEERLILELLFLILMIGAKINSIPSFTPSTNQILTRNANLPKATFEMIKTAQKTHQLVKNRCFMSTSTAEKNKFTPYTGYQPLQAAHPVVFKIQPLAVQSFGRDVSQATQTLSEQEVLYLPTASFVVNDVMESEERATILLQEVNSMNANEPIWVL